MKFTDLAAWKDLNEKAKKAPDLTKPGVLSGARIDKYRISACNLEMLYATERVSDEICNDLVKLAKEADVLEKMEFLQNMEVMNYVNNFESENRMVGHTAIRHPNPGKEYSDHVRQASKEYQVEIDKLKHFLPKVEKFTSMIVVGIGGSYLGALAVYDALKAYQTNNRKLYFASNVDPDKVASILEEVDLKTTLVAIISKSGGTLEIKAQQQLLQKRFEEAKLHAKDHFIMVTGKGSPMDVPGKYREIFYMWDFIGGRYSVSSMVGAVPLTFMLGMNIWMEFLRGLHDMDMHAVKEKDPQKNLPLWGALLGVWNRNFLNCNTVAIIPYSQGMLNWTLHLQQLFMESNGKMVCKEDGSFINYPTCPVVWGSVGTEGQHSYYQGIHQGTQVIPVEFLGFKIGQLKGDEIIENTTNQEKLLANMVAQSLALATGQHAENHNKFFPGNRSARMIIANQLDAYTLGNILAYYEHVAAFQGFLWDINSFDQEGVQLGKVLANSILELYKTKRQTGAYPKTKEREAPLAYLKHLDQIGGSRKGKDHKKSA